ncbi:hypothetical protein A3C24_03010 [Candidatus Roizmanbacteria bacterium RIFCSPHIGHO2_02_FULL_37_24]|uniref:Uncharacterized protein n=1 Tax=Candidatus Roizmanbacteria bacterium RIFCSPHIGHO2_02_FULL_37_24 TaxID=1802037 RepID=A0A1F7GYV5_9BACT|nr:MAG: hypothetical protein A3C24_03010 [Candidatus Roizmanbacteria bacterium RIFCSPHIGHO2_02_FULL_37_24]OGK32353.1 MAG: hypothetical protein A3E10_04180 [Candidatus Roizmanbacteria bacterium RIFCSPHIGHO2_12_FULL_37_23]OGK44873.1 MAG: hypothetical protein A2956_03930 [Candidatus Roizmanbacteria bacterium RIFCSPLOWO2_01_FULL_37_57]OGK61389.1 MAG: hypothetical protein A3G65_01585 [Candidatus Roizmanbacteria bacterium RIFCSPLOWO2_12_FULL_37_7b]
MLAIQKYQISEQEKITQMMFTLNSEDKHEFRVKQIINSCHAELDSASIVIYIDSGSSPE